jgi:arylsulfatase B
MTGSTKPDAVKFDGVSLRNLLDPAVDVQWPERFIVTDSQRVVDPIKWRQSAVMSQDWRLINGEELYQIDLDPGQRNDVAAGNPGQVAIMREFYEDWWAELEPTFSQTTEIYVGHPENPVVKMTAHDWIGASGTPWHQGFIRSAYPLKPGGARDGDNDKKFVHQGHWAVKVLSDGDYRITVRRWPVEADLPITASLAAGENVPGATVAYRAVEGQSIPATSVTLRIDGKIAGAKPVSPADREVVFIARLEKGSHQVSPVFHTRFGDFGAYYTIISPGADE